MAVAAFTAGAALTGCSPQSTEETSGSGTATSAASGTAVAATKTAVLKVEGMT